MRAEARSTTEFAIETNQSDFEKKLKRHKLERKENSRIVKHHQRRELHVGSCHEDFGRE
jgi:hypothetical protein